MSKCQIFDNWGKSSILNNLSYIYSCLYLSCSFTFIFSWSAASWPFFERFSLNELYTFIVDGLMQLSFCAVQIIIEMKYVICVLFSYLSA